MPHLTCSIKDQIATITLNHAPQNRFDRQMVDQLELALNQIGDSDARAVLVQAEGNNFSFGGDIRPWPDLSRSELRALCEHYMTVFNRFEQLPLPVIVAVNGICFGAGLELALRADIVVAGEGAKFGHPEPTIGVVTLLGGIYRLAERVGRNRAFEWVMTSRPIPAQVAEELGLVNKVVADDAVVTHAEELARIAADGPTRAHAAHKALLRVWGLGGIAAADQVMFDVAAPLFETADTIAGLASAVNALNAGTARPAMRFEGR